MKKIVIELLSDSCLASGEVYNSSIDTEVCYDEYGFPFISAKRLKGCLRESALELFDFGLSDFEQLNITVEDLFGIAGNQEAVFSLQNARLENYRKYVTELKQCKKKEYTNQQAVLEEFTYIRQQTSLNIVTGTAEETSLRSMRVMKKGLIFEAYMDIPDKYDEIFGKICKNVKFMGLNRTRGMGEVSLVYDKNEKTCEEKRETVLWNEQKDYVKLCYQIKLQSPILLKSVAGGQSKTLSYIEGSKILGMIAQNIKLDKDEKIDFLEFMKEGELICSNAYISDENNSKRYVPVSASLYHVKNEKNNLRDKAYPNAVEEGKKEGKQLCQLQEYYVSGDTEESISKLSVKKELHYHHTRPKDKSKGRVIGDGNSEENGKLFYMESMIEGQCFSGYILGSKKQLKYIYDFLKKRPQQKIGYSKNVEYGQVLVTVSKLETEEESRKKEIFGCEFVVKLNSSAIFYNENGMYSTDKKVFQKYIEELLLETEKESVDIEIVNDFLSYGLTGGYQTTWRMHKPVIAVFEKGTTIVFRIKDGKEINISNLDGKHIGERIQEGYGELSVYELPKNYKKEFIDSRKVKSRIQETEMRLIKKIALKKAKEYTKFLAREDAKKIPVDSKLKAVNANLLLMCEQQATFEKFYHNITERYKENTLQKSEKLHLARSIISKDFKISDILDKVLEVYPEAEEALKLDMVYKLYVKSLLLAVKYAIRGEET